MTSPELEAFEEDTPPRPGAPVDAERVRYVLAERWKPLTSGLLGGVVLGALIFFLWPETYISTAQLLYEGSGVFALKDMKRDPAALIASATFPDQLRAVRKRLGQEQLSLEDLAERLEAEEGKDRNLMAIEGEADSAAEAAALVDALVHTFQERQKKLNKKRIQELLAATEASLGGAKTRVKEAQARSDAFNKKTGLASVISEREQLLKKLGTLKVQADQEQVNAAALEAQITELKATKSQLPLQITATSTVGHAMDGPLAKARADLAQAEAALSGEHPRVQALRERVARMESERQSTQGRVGAKTLAFNPTRQAVDQSLAKARADLAAAKRREKSLRRLIQKAETDAQSLSPVEAQARALREELVVATKHLADLNQRATLLRDGLQAPSSGFRLLSAASLPEAPDRSGLRNLLVFFAPLFGMFIIAAYFLFHELSGLRLRTAKEVAWWGRGPVIGTTVWPRIDYALEEFVGELEDHGVYGVGQTLVVPATEGERDVACAFATRLAEAPWLAAAILDIEIDPKMRRLMSGYPQAMLPPSSIRALSPGSGPLTTPPPKRARKATIQGFSIPPEEAVLGGHKDRDATQMHGASPIPLRRVSSTPPPGGNANAPDRRFSLPPIPGVSRASVRMVINAKEEGGATRQRSRDGAKRLTPPKKLTPPMIIVGEGSKDSAGLEPAPKPGSSDAVLKAAIRVLSDESQETSLALPRPSLYPPLQSGVALAWNGPLSGPVLRRAARLSDRVIVVVSSGMPAIDLSKLPTRLGREDGVGYVLVNLDDAFAESDDRVGEVEAFWGSEPPTAT